MKKLLLLTLGLFSIVLLSWCSTHQEPVIQTSTGTELIETGNIQITWAIVKQIEYSYTPMDSYAKNFDCLLWEEDKEEKDCMQSWYMNTYKFSSLWLELQTWETKILGEWYYVVEGNKIYNPQRKQNTDWNEQILVYNSFDEVQKAIPNSWCTITLSTSDTIQWLKQYDVSNNRPWPLCNTQNKEAIVTIVYENTNNGKWYLFEGFDGCAPWSCNSYDTIKWIE